MRLALIALLRLVPAAARANYRVYCARGGGLCQMGPRFGFRMDAQTFAERNFGGAGKPCSCR